MDLQKRIENIKNYFYDMKMSTEDGIVYIQTRFPSNWTISELLEDNFKVRGVDTKKGTQIFFTEINNGFEKVFDAIDYTIQMNISALERLDLFRTKIDELKELFDNEDIEKLKRLEFTFKKPEKKRTKKTKEVDLVSQIVTDERCYDTVAYNGGEDVVIEQQEEE
jgi:hypothetical protein